MVATEHDVLRAIYRLELRQDIGITLPAYRDAALFLEMEFWGQSGVSEIVTRLKKQGLVLTRRRGHTLYFPKQRTPYWTLNGTLWVVCTMQKFICAAPVELYEEFASNDAYLYSSRRIKNLMITSHGMCCDINDHAFHSLTDTGVNICKS